MTATCHLVSGDQGLSAGSSGESWVPIFQMEGALSPQHLPLSLWRPAPSALV